MVVLTPRSVLLTGNMAFNLLQNSPHIELCFIIIFAWRYTNFPFMNFS